MLSPDPKRSGSGLTVLEFTDSASWRVEALLFSRGGWRCSKCSSVHHRQTAQRCHILQVSRHRPKQTQLVRTSRVYRVMHLHIKVARGLLSISIPRRSCIRLSEFRPTRAFCYSAILGSWLLGSGLAPQVRRSSAGLRV